MRVCARERERERERERVEGDSVRKFHSSTCLPFRRGFIMKKIHPWLKKTITHPETVTVTLQTPTKMSMRERQCRNLKHISRWCCWNCCCHVPFWRGHDAGSLLVTQSTRSWKGMRMSAYGKCSELRMFENILFNMLNSLYLPDRHCDENKLNATLLSCSALLCIYVWNKYLTFLKIKYFKRWLQDWLILKGSYILM